MMLPESEAAEETTIQLDAVLDGRAALHARELVDGAPPDARLALDFARVRDVEYIALATLVVAIARRPGHPVVLRGLCEQHVRVLRYLGVDVSLLERPDDATDEEETTPAEAPQGADAGAVTSPAA